MPAPLLALSLFLDGPTVVGDALVGLGWEAVISTLYTAGLASLVGSAIFNSLLSRHPSSAVVPWVLLAPVVAMAAGWWLLDQRPSTGETAGGLLLLLGALIALSSKVAPTVEFAVGSDHETPVAPARILDRS
ncbi:MAG: EamA family transporter [Aeromicrobium sp.]